MKLIAFLFPALATAAGAVNGGFENSNQTIAPWTPSTRPIVHPGLNSPNAVRLTRANNSVTQNVTLDTPKGFQYKYSFSYKFKKTTGAARTSALAVRIGSLYETTVTNFRNLTAGSQSWVTVNDIFDSWNSPDQTFNIVISVDLAADEYVDIDTVAFTNLYDNFGNGSSVALQNPGFQSGSLSPGWRGAGSVQSAGQGEYVVIPRGSFGQSVSLTAGQLYSVTFDYLLGFTDRYCNDVYVSVGFGGFRSLQTSYGRARALPGGQSYTEIVIAQPGWTNLTITGYSRRTGNVNCSPDSFLSEYRLDNFRINRVTYNNTNPYP